MKRSGQAQRSAVGAILAAALAMASGPAPALAAPDVESCAASYEEAQRRQGKGELLAAREQATRCADPACPGDIVGFCSTMAADLDKALPSVVVAALDPEGRDVTGATLSIDRAPAVPVDGRPLSLDPGDHTLRVEAEGRVGAEETVSVRAGEKNRRVELRLGGNAGRGGGSAAPPPPREHPLLVPGAIVTALGGAGLVLGAITGGLALADDGALADVCSPPSACPSSERERIDRMNTLGVVSTVGFVVGGVGVATGLVLLIVDATSGGGGPVAATADGLAIRF